MLNKACSAVLAFAAMTGLAYAEGPVDEIVIGAASQGWGAQGADKEQGVGINGEVRFSSPSFLSFLGSPRPHIGGTVATDSDATSQIYAGLIWRQHLSPRFFVAGSLGGMIHNGEVEYDPVADANRLSNTTFLGCRALFRLAADVGYDVTDHINASVFVAHASNAGLCSENEGLDNLGMRIGYRF